MFMMRFDLRAPGKDAQQRADLYQALLDMAAWADERGCASITISEHHASEDGYLPSPISVASAVAAVTKNTPITIAAALLALYEPVRLAEELIALDHLSRGRAVVILGLGYRPVEYDLHGVDFERRGQVVDEKLEALLTAMGDAVAGEKMPRITPPPYSPNGPMLAWGGGSKAAARRAGRNGLGFLAQTNLPGLREAYEEAARAAGHEPGMCMLPSPDMPSIVFVNDDVDAGWRDVGQAMLNDAIPYMEWNIEAGTADFTASLSKGRTVEELRAENGAHRVVTVDQAADLIKTWGALALHPLCGGLDPAVAWPYLRRVVDEVLPAVGAQS
jgi:alkanesulfonate monooxygenase SsuD/methylene tetrahydromethanopterin reductase-like flavin-dependent oxidoreductase (luciferase family)